MILTPKNDYTDDWKSIANIVKTDAGWACVRCHHPHDVGAGRMLTVHHFDGDKANNARWNLMALCQACHLSVQARVNPHTPLLFDCVSIWAMPYIAGFYDANSITPVEELRFWQEQYTLDGRIWPEWAPQ